MTRLDPHALFARLARDIPTDLHPHLFVAGSLAAAYHFADRLQDRAVNTKDADVVVHPAGDVGSCRRMAERLRAIGWTPKLNPGFRPQPAPVPTDGLPFVRLFPPDSTSYFVEFLSLPPIGQKDPLHRIPIEFAEGWFAVPSFRYFVLLELHRQRSVEGLEYAVPSMMALANLLAHPVVGTQVIEGDGRLRSAKDLGRVLAVARLTNLDELDHWARIWLDALQRCFPDDWRKLGGRAGSGLRELLAADIPMTQAQQFNETGLLSGMNVSRDMLRATGLSLLQSVLEPLEQAARS